MRRVFETGVDVSLCRCVSHRPPTPVCEKTLKLQISIVLAIEGFEAPLRTEKALCDEYDDCDT